MVPPPEADCDHASKVSHLFRRQDEPHRNVASSITKLSIWLLHHIASITAHRHKYQNNHHHFHKCTKEHFTQSLLSSSISQTMGPVPPNVMQCPQSNTLSTHAASELDVLWCDRDALGVDGTQIGVLKEAYQVGLGCFQQRQ